ncbi:MAG: hypothetical protein IPH43_15865 [Xanthomonadales bacterium]|nr:hypothetical protein [Xanthomonadales bacterium]
MRSMPVGQKERRTALRLFAQLQAEGFDGSYTRVTEAIAPGAPSPAQ